MEANSQLRGVIQEMQKEINKLEKENQALRMKLTASCQKAPGSEDESEEVTDVGNPGEVPGQSLATLPGGVSTDSATAAHEHQDNVMIVRRYSISSLFHSFAANDPWKAGKRHPHRGIPEAQGTIKSLACSSIKKQDNEEKTLVAESLTSNCPSQRSCPEHGPGFRDKMKTVSFQLPMDISSYSKNASSLKYPPNQITNQLSTVAE
ncbi:putative coiled-coil domain-containing protein 195 [Talpa occidentalis]|uniref:putative coiled-coil domain-containing protein 195 n=1 Tax=Talpa occidentalis TaxID=50954 RepID=UPI0023F9B557|nr:putative coiled-coil domain-containing protein 195 [Talpa occidentalis]